MRKIIGILIVMVMCITLSSCVTAAQAQIDGVYYDDNIDISVVITYGTPYYNAEGLLLYYIYHNMYYYPYYYNNRYYLHRYSRPLPPNRMRAYHPVPKNFYKQEPPRSYRVTPPNRSTYHMRPNMHSTQSRPKGNVSPSNRSGRSHGHFGRSHR